MSEHARSAHGGRLPDFIIAGAPRAGTSWLYEVLDRHPQIYMARPRRPEPKFFLVEEEYARGLEYYSDTWFAGADEKTAGEKSTNYLESCEAAQRIAACLPRVKLIFILREPAERALSNYRWSRQNGLESLTFAQALRLEPEREAGYNGRERLSRPYSYYSRGLYADLLKPYLDLFPLDQLLFLRYEDMISEPGAHVTRTHQFLGIEPRPQDGATMAAVNSSEGAGEGEVDVANLRERYRASNRRLAALLDGRFAVWEGSV